MSKMTKILLIIMAVSLVPLGMLGAMLYFGGTADSPAGGTIDLGKAADTADGGRYTGASGGTIMITYRMVQVTAQQMAVYRMVQLTAQQMVTYQMVLMQAVQEWMSHRPQLTTITAASMYQSFLTVCGRTCRGRAIRRAALLSVKTCAMFMSCMWTSREEAVRASWL